MRIGPGSLKCVIACSGRRPLRDVMESALRDHVRDADIRHLHGDVFLVYTQAGPSEVRDWLRPCLEDGESVLVVEFERWSGQGPAPDRDWLRARGH